MNKDILQARILEAKEAYYEGNPIISDAEYDFLEDALRKIDPNNSVLKKVGSSMSHRKKIKHLSPMRSLQKVKTQKDLINWYKRCGFNDSTSIEATFKFDGLSGVIHYRDGKLVSVATRGDGKEGLDVTHLAEILKLPKTLKSSGDLFINGEFILPLDTPLAKVYHDSPLRNLAAGLVGKKDPNEKEIKEIEMLQFNPFNVTGDLNISDLETKGFNVPERFVKAGIGDIIELLSYLDKYRSEYLYQTDGIVLKPSDKKICDELEDGDAHHPKWSVAWKFKETEDRQTTLRNITWQVSRLGRLIPVAEFDEVIISNTKISRATLNNWTQVYRDKYVPGSIITVIKANDVIPKVTSVNNSNVNKISEKAFISSIENLKCSSCGTPAVMKELHAVCTNTECKDIVIAKILHWVVNSGMEYINESTIKTLYEHNKIRSIKDFYELQEGDLEGIPGLGSSKIKNILGEIARSKTLTFAAFFKSLGIQAVGNRMAEKLGVKSVADLYAFKDRTYIAGQVLCDWVKENDEYLKELLSIIKVKEEKKISNGISVCATGSAPMKRDELKKLLIEKGYQWSDDVKSNTGILLTDDINGDSSKLKKAKKNGITIKTYNDFFKEIKK